jgi:serine/threonine protein phosphatase PrpC
MNEISVMMFDLDDAVTPSVALNDVKSGGISSKAGSSTARSKSDSTPSFVAVALDVLATDPLDVGPTSNSAHFYKSRPSSSKNLNQDNFTELHWQSGYCTILGPRSKNEDRLVALPDLTEETGVIKSNLPFSSSNLNTSSSQAYFAVYDGHCGDGASTYMQRHFHIEVCKHPTFWTDLRRAVAETAIRLDKEFLANCKETKINCGTTALGAFIRGSSLLVFNIGDCHAVISSGGKPRNLSEAHKPNRTDERERITRAGGWVTEERELYMARLHLMDIQDPLVNSLARNIDFVSIYRVCGDLAVTRSIGDPDYKSVIPGQPVTHWFPWPDGHDKIFNADLVIPDPEMTLMTLTSEDEFMILASDGLWDVINSIDAVKIVHEKFLKGKSSSQVAEELCELALRLGSSDNVTIVIIQFVYT